MSRESDLTLNTLTLIGFTEQRGHAWHYRQSLQGAEPNHYPGAVPVGDVARRLFDWQAESRRVAVELPADVETATHLDDEGRPVRWVAQGDRQAITRSDTGAVLGLFHDGYRAHQYQEWLLNTVSSILGDTLHIGSACLLAGGGRAWVSVEVPESIKTPEGVTFRPNLLAATSFDGSLATTYKRVVTNVVCDNTMAVALAEDGQQVKVRHSRHSEVRITEARDALALVHDTADEFAAQVAQLCRTKVSTRQWDAFVDAAAPTARNGQPITGRALTNATAKRQQLRDLYARDERVAPWAGTGWGVLQAANTWSHHVQNVRGSDRADRNTNRAIMGDTENADRATLALLERVLTTA